MIINNIENIKFHVLRFEQPDDFYMLSILQRKKDHPESTSANENARMLYNTYVRNVPYFERKIPLIKEFCEKFHARCYIKPQVRSGKQINRQLLKFMCDQVDNWDLNYYTLTREIISGFHDSRDKRIVLDLDDITYEQVKEIEDTVINWFKDMEKKKEEEDKKNKDKEQEESEDKKEKPKKSEQVFINPTFNGYHIIAPGFDPRILQQYVDKGYFQTIKDVWKSDADTIVYACRPNQKGDGHYV